MKPIIGLTCQYDSTINRGVNRINAEYINAIAEAGGIPFIIPNLESTEDIGRYLDIVNGIIFTGGEDVSAQYFKEEPIKEVTEVSRDRDITEMALFEKAYEKGIPIMGVCRGMQLINIALGGSLYQDIYVQVPNVFGNNNKISLKEGFHTINISKDSLVYEIFNKESLLVNSLHHQACKELGRNLKVAAQAKDGIIEAIESTNEKFVLGLQFHPETMAMKYKEFLKPYKYFVEVTKHTFDK